VRYITDQYAVHLLDFFVRPKGANAAMDGIDEQQAAAFAKELSELSKEQSEALQGAVHIKQIPPRDRSLRSARRAHL